VQREGAFVANLTTDELSQIQNTIRSAVLAEMSAQGLTVYALIHRMFDLFGKDTLLIRPRTVYNFINEGHSMGIEKVGAIMYALGLYVAKLPEPARPKIVEPAPKTISFVTNVKQPPKKELII
jgi:hypothetical protein